MSPQPQLHATWTVFLLLIHCKCHVCPEDSGPFVICRRLESRHFDSEMSRGVILRLEALQHLAAPVGAHFNETTQTAIT